MTFSEFGRRPNENQSRGTDFRQVYATILDKWFSCPTSESLGKGYKPLPFI